jgi:hypothetical protein
MRLDGDWLAASSLIHGGPILTRVLQMAQRKEVGVLPPGQNETARTRADQRSLEITGPTALGQIRYMAGFTPPRKDELSGRVDSVRYIHAPGFEDDFVKTGRASHGWRLGYGAGTNFQDVPMTNWLQGEHTRTLERTADVAAQILAVADVYTS